jgi:hypothetical protein
MGRWIVPQRREDRDPSEKFRATVQATIQAFIDERRPLVAPEIVSAIFDAHWSKWRREPDGIARFLGRTGALHHTGALLKRYHEEREAAEAASEARVEQVLLLVPEEEQKIISKIRHTYLYDPRPDKTETETPPTVARLPGEYLPIESMTTDELERAGLYLIRKGQDCIIRGKNILELAEIRRRNGSVH